MAKLRVILLIMFAGFAASSNAAILSDDAYTYGLWHMDSSFTTTSRTWIADDDSQNTSRNNHFAFGSSSSSNTNDDRYPTLTTGSGGYDGEALVFDGSDDMCYAPYDVWPGYDSIRIELWFKQDSTSGDQTLIAGYNGVPWEIRLSYNQVRFYSWYEYYSGGNCSTPIDLRVGYSQNEWTHVVAIIATNGIVSLEVNGVMNSTTYDNYNMRLRDSSPTVYLACQYPGNRHFDGMIDEVKISQVPPSRAILNDSLKTFALWHMDSSFTTTTRTWVGDDDSLNTSRNNDLAFGNSSSNNTNQDGYPTLTTGNGGYKGEALIFDGSDDMCYAPYDVWPGYDSVRIELWFKQDSTSNPQTLISGYNGVPWEIRLNYNRVYFYSWYNYYSDGTSAGLQELSISYSATADEWNHVVASVSADGLITLKVNDSKSTKEYDSYSTYLRNYTTTVYLGCQSQGDKYFDGMIDEVQISKDTVQVDDSLTFGLWHLDSLFADTERTWISDDDNDNTSRNNFFALGHPSSSNSSNSSYPTLTTGNGGYDGEALDFDGSDDMCYLPYELWPGSDSVRIELWFKQEGGESVEQALISAFNCSPWHLRLLNGNIHFYSFYEYVSDGSYAGVVSLSQGFTENEWNHVIAVVRDDGVVSLCVNGTVTTTSYDPDVKILNDSSVIVSLGCNLNSYGTSIRHFNGLIDEVKISTVEIGDNPRLFFTADDIPDIAATFDDPNTDDPNIVAVWNSIESRADAYCDPSSSSYKNPSTHYANASSWSLGECELAVRDAQSFFETIGFVYQMTGDSDYGEHGAALLDAFVQVEEDLQIYTTGNSYEMVRTLSTAYDWLASAMTPAQKARVEAVAKKYLDWSFEYFGEVGEKTGGYVPYHNYTGVAFGGAGLLALALEDVYPNEASHWINGAKAHVLSYFNQGMDPGGTNLEGVYYMNFALSNSIAFADALNINKNVNIMTHTALQNLPEYLAMSRLPGTYTFEGRNDSPFIVRMDPAILRLSEANNSSLLKYIWNTAKEAMDSDDYDTGLEAYKPDYHYGGYSPLRILWDNDVVAQDPDTAQAPLGDHYEYRGLASFRSGWDTDDTLFSIEAGPYRKTTHDQSDQGHFGFYGLGSIWSSDPGYGCKTTSAHSCILVDGVGQALAGSGAKGVDGEILSYADYGDYCHVLVDANEAYDQNNDGDLGAVVEYALRDAVYVRPRSGKAAYAVVFDDIKKDESSHEFTWQLITHHDMKVDLSGSNPLIKPAEYLRPTGFTNVAYWEIDVPQTATYTLFGRFRLGEHESATNPDSFYVAIDSGSYNGWGYGLEKDWHWDRYGTNVYLTAGTHTIKIKTCEKGSELESLFITCDPNVVNDSDVSPYITSDSDSDFLLQSTETSYRTMPLHLADKQMEVVMDASASIDYVNDFYGSYPRLKAICTAVNPKFISFMMPHYDTDEVPDVSFEEVTGGKKIVIEWNDCYDEMTWTDQGIDVDLSCDY